HQRTACGVAAKVNDGTITSPPSIPAALSMVIRASCPLQKASVGTPRYSASRCSNFTTHGPLFVTCPDARAARNEGRKHSRAGKFGGTIFRGCSKKGAPPRRAMFLRIRPTANSSTTDRYLGEISQALVPVPADIRAKETPQRVRPDVLRGSAAHRLPVA